jgi:hypothetical protein
MTQAGDTPSNAGQPPAHPSTWSSWPQAARLISTPAILRRTVLIALVVGTILSIINQANVIASGSADTATWLRVAANYLVPFIVSNAGALSATRRETNPTDKETRQ